MLVPILLSLGVIAGVYYTAKKAGTQVGAPFGFPPLSALAASQRKLAPEYDPFGGAPSQVLKPGDHVLLLAKNLPGGEGYNQVLILATTGVQQGNAFPIEWYGGKFSGFVLQMQRKDNGQWVTGYGRAFGPAAQDWPASQIVQIIHPTPGMILNKSQAQAVTKPGITSDSRAVAPLWYKR